MSQDDLLERLQRLRHRIRQIVMLYGLSWVAAVGLGLLLVVGWTDWLLHLDDSGTRLLLGVAILGATGWIAQRRLIAPLRAELSDVELALRIERRYPSLRDSLVSTIQFVTGGVSAELGSPALQQRVIRRTLKQLEGLEFDEVVHTRSASRVAALALLIVCTSALVVGLNQAEAATALRRLAFPFSNHPWPRQTQLQFVTADWEGVAATTEDPLRVARGETVEWYVVNLRQTGRLPGDVRIEIRNPQNRVTSHAVQRSTLRDRQDQPREVGVFSLSVREPLQFRAIGGDDRDMEWMSLDVVPPPVVQDLQVRLVPPTYSHQEPRLLSPGVGHLEALVGTQVEVRATSSKPLQQAHISLKDAVRIPLTVSSNGLELTGSFTLKEAGVYSYWLDLRDLRNFGNQDAPRYEIRAIQDAAPIVDLERPETDRQITPTALVDVRFLARDDLGLKETRLLWAKLGESGPGTPTTLELPPLSGHPQRQTIDYQWSIAQLNLQPGDQVQIHAEASDEFDLGEPHVGRSLPRTLTIVSPEDKAQELTEQESSLHDQLEQTLKLQTEIETQTAVLQQQLDKAGTLRREDLDQLQRLEQQQRQVTGQLLNEQSGAATRAKQLQAEFERNQLPTNEAGQRLDRIRELTQSLGERQLPRIEEALQAVRRQAPQSPQPAADATESTASTTEQLDPDKPSNTASPEKTGTSTDQPRQSTAPDDKQAPDKPDPKRLDTPAAALQSALKQQGEVREQLGELVQELDQWHDQQQVQRDLQEIRDAQQRLNEETSNLSKETVTKRWNELTRQQQADLARQAERQQIQARQINQLQRRLEAIEENLEQKSSDAADHVRDTLQELLDEGLAAKMRDVARQLAENNVGQAVRGQQEIQEQLQQLTNSLRKQTEDDPEKLVKQFEQARTQLDQLEKEQTELLKKTAEVQQADGDPAEQAQQVEQLRQQIAQQQRRVQELLRRLRKTPAQEARQQLQEVAERLEKLAQQQNPAAEEAGVDPIEEQREILDELQNVEQKLAQEEEELREQLAAEEFEKTADRLRSLVTRQQGVVDETQRLEKLRVEKGSWSRPQLKSLRDLADVEQGLAKETQQVAEQVSQSAALRQALELAARGLTRIAERLTNRQTDAQTVQHEEQVRDQLAEIVQILTDKSDQAHGGQPQQPGEGEQAGGGGAALSEDRITLIAELKLLRAMQVRLNLQRQELTARDAAGAASNPETTAAWKAMAEDQARLAELLADYAAQAQAHSAQAIEAPSEAADQEPEIKSKSPPKKNNPPAADPDAIQPE